MYMIMERLAATFGDTGCGATLDFFRGTTTTPTLVQWLWAIPVREIDERQLDDAGLLTRIIRELGAVGFRPVDPRSSGPSARHLTLPNGHRYDEACPFDIEMCPGPHLIISGAGALTAAPVALPSPA